MIPHRASRSPPRRFFRVSFELLSPSLARLPPWNPAEPKRTAKASARLFRPAKTRGSAGPCATFWSGNRAIRSIGACFTTCLWSRFSPGSDSAPTDSPPRPTARRRPIEALGDHPYLAVFLVAMTAGTVFVISYAYSLLIEHFPGGGGGYLVATKLLGPRVGVVSGCALIVDYVLTITVSVATGCDAVFSFLPAAWESRKLAVEVFVLVLLVVLNLRGVKESVTFLLPIFLVFVATHALMIGYGLFTHASALPAVLQGAAAEGRRTASALGLLPTLFILLRAYSLGGGTYTGIEAVSNGVQILREPRVANAKKTMLYMALSLAFTAGGILFCYLLIRAQSAPRQDAELGAGRKPLRAVEARVSSDRPDSRHRHHGLGGSAALRRGADRVHRRAAHPGQHGRRFVDAAALRPALGPARHEERHLPDGRRRRRRPALLARQERSADPDVLDQRLSDVHPDRARDVALLDPKPPGAPGLAPQPGHPRNGPDDVPL